MAVVFWLSVPLLISTPEVDSLAAARSLSSWYLRRDSRGRTPFSRYMRRATSFSTTESSSESASSKVRTSEDSLETVDMPLILRITRNMRF